VASKSVIVFGEHFELNDDLVVVSDVPDVCVLELIEQLLEPLGHDLLPIGIGYVMMGLRLRNIKLRM